MAALPIYRLALAGVALIAVSAAMAGPGTTAQGAGRTYKNPVYNQDFPDPNVMKVGSTYYGFATSPIGGGAYVPELKTTDLVHWKQSGLGGDAMPIPSRWINRLWAPTVGRLNNGSYVMYYTGENSATQQQCVGVATSKSPTGQFRDLSTKPWLCQTKLGGTIDADVFRNGKSLYLYYKNDGNSNGNKTYIWVQRLSADGKKRLGKAVKLIYNSKAWERDVVEAPSMWKHAGKYYLFFSGNHWDSAYYAVGYATCRGPLGPCTQANAPILEYTTKSSCNAEGPGGQSIVTDKKGQTWMLYAAWVGDAVGYGATGGKRALWLDKLNWKAGKPVINGPTCTPQPAPAT